MFAKNILIGFALMVSAVPLDAQRRGTIEFGGFASNTAFDESLAVASGWGAGARVGAYLFPRLSIEVEGTGTTATNSVFSARLLAAPLRLGPVSVLLGAGVDHTDVDVLKSYGVHGLLGAKLAISNAIAVRAGWVESYLANGESTNRSLQLGLSAHRSP